MATKVWAIDASHSKIEFKVRHMMVSNVRGEFKEFTGELVTEEEDFSTGKAKFEASLDSITTGVEQRDNHLKSDDFFNAAEHPKLTFVSKGIKKIDDDDYEMTGDMTIRGITKEVKLKVEQTGIVNDDWGFRRAGFEISGEISRKEFGLKYNAAMEAGGMVVGDKVKLSVTTEITYKL
ncbi:MAG: YceI family protein [Chitinophagales bacterium]|nr:YceI family protein [Chitinophagales bacterium]